MHCIAMLKLTAVYYLFKQRNREKRGLQEPFIIRLDHPMILAPSSKSKNVLIITPSDHLNNGSITFLSSSTLS